MAEQAYEDWSGPTGDRWLANIDTFEAMLAPLHQRLADSLELAPDEMILDIGCGSGPLSLMLGEKLQNTGEVVGLDIAPQLIALARQRAAQANLANVRFEVGDAALASPEGAPFDRLISAFGVMFFRETEPAFAHLHGLARQGGALDFYAWAAPEKNPWMGLVMRTMAAHVELPERDPNAPGPFRLSDVEITSDMLRRAGFKDILAREFEHEQALGGPGASVDQAVEFVMSGLDSGKLLKEQGGDESAARADLANALAPYASDAGVMMPATILHYSAAA